MWSYFLGLENVVLVLLEHSEVVLILRWSQSDGPQYQASCHCTCMLVFPELT